MKHPKFYKHLPMIFLGIIFFVNISLFFLPRGILTLSIVTVFIIFLLVCYFFAFDANCKIKNEEMIGEFEGYLKELDKIDKEDRDKTIKNNIKYIFKTIKDIPSIIPYLIAHNKILSKDVYQAKIELLPKIVERKYKKYLQDKKTKTLTK